MFERIAIFWAERKKTASGRLYLLWLVAFVICAIAALRSSEFPLRTRLGILLGGSALMFLGLIVCYFVPTQYLAYIRRRKEEQRPVLMHRVLFGLYIFPFIPFLFMAMTTLVMSTGLFDK